MGIAGRGSQELESDEDLKVEMLSSTVEASSRLAVVASPDSEGPIRMNEGCRSLILIFQRLENILLFSLVGFKGNLLDFFVLLQES